MQPVVALSHGKAKFAPVLPFPATNKIQSVALAILLYGCGGDGLVMPPGAEIGTYALTTINGTPPPVTVAQTSASKAEVIRAAVTLDANGLFRDVTDTRITTKDTAFVSSDTVQGSWGRSRNTINFSPESDEIYQMELGAASLTRIKSSLTWIYTR